MPAQTTVFSDFEVKQLGFIFGTNDAQTFGCVGSIEQESTVKKVTKKCRGVVKKRKTRGTGEGTIKISAHVPYDVLVKMRGMELPTCKDGVYAYGTESVHATFALTALSEDEDGNERYLAWPNCVDAKGQGIKVTNGDEEVQEIELELEYSPDEFGNGSYEAMKSSGDTACPNWMTKFTSASVRKENA